MSDKQLGLYKTLLVDVSVLSGASPSFGSMARCFFGRAGYQAVVFYRVAAAFKDAGLFGRIVSRLLARWNLALHGCDIDRLSTIGPGLKLPHPCGIVIGPCSIGSGVMILQNVTIGMRNFTDDESDHNYFPVIGSNVTISAGAVIVGSVRVGDGAIIGANAVVLKNVPDGHTAVGVPARSKERKLGQ